MDPVDIVVKTLQQVPQELLQWGADIYCIDFGFRYPEMRYKNGQMVLPEVLFIFL